MAELLRCLQCNNVGSRGVKLTSKEYIKRTEFEHIILNEDVEIVKHRCKDYESYINGANQFRFQMKNAIQKANAADVAEVKHGRWILKSRIYKMFDDVDEEFYVECNLCNREEPVCFELGEQQMLDYAKRHYPYCHCGAKMDLEV